MNGAIENSVKRFGATFIKWIGIIALLALLPAADSFAQELRKPKKRVKTIYRKYTEVDLSGSSVQGKVRAPEVFYIFQRKRSERHDVLSTPRSLAHHRSGTLFRLRRLVK